MWYVPSQFDDRKILINENPRTFRLAENEEMFANAVRRIVQKWAEKKINIYLLCKLIIGNQSKLFEFPLSI